MLSIEIAKARYGKLRIKLHPDLEEVTVLQIAEQIGYKLAKHSNQTAKCDPFSRWKTPYKPSEH